MIRCYLAVLMAGVECSRFWDDGVRAVSLIIIRKEFDKSVSLIIIRKEFDKLVRKERPSLVRKVRWRCECERDDPH